MVPKALPNVQVGGHLPIWRCISARARSNTSLEYGLSLFLGTDIVDLLRQQLNFSYMFWVFRRNAFFPLAGGEVSLVKSVFWFFNKRDLSYTVGVPYLNPPRFRADGEPRGEIHENPDCVAEVALI